MYTAHSEEYKGYTISIVQDDTAQNPYEDWDFFGTMTHWHRRGFIGENYANRQEELRKKFNKIKADGGIVVPVYLYEHSGQTINTTGFSCPWDSGQVGFMYATAKSIRENFQVKRITKKTREKAEELLKSEVKTIDDYLTGNVYGFQISKGDEVIDSCWGYFGGYKTSGILDDAKSSVDYEEKKDLPLLAATGVLNA